ncbi:MAG: ribosome-binding factor A [Minisyncoccia bacterium]
MRPYRNLKIAALIQEKLSEIFVREFNFEGALVTIVGVDVDEKLDKAFVKLSILPFQKGPEMFTMIDKSRRALEHKLLRIMNIKPMPRLVFKIEQ